MAGIDKGACLDTITAGGATWGAGTTTGCAVDATTDFIGTAAGAGAETGARVGLLVFAGGAILTCAVFGAGAGSTSFLPFSLSFFEPPNHDLIRDFSN